MLEDKYIKIYSPNYNILLEACSSYGYTHSEDTKLRMKLNYTEERKELLRQVQYNIKNKWTSEQINKLRETALNRSHNYIYEKGKLKIKEVFSKKVTLFNENNEKLCNFINIKETANYLNCSIKTIQRALLKGYIYLPLAFDKYLNMDKNIPSLEKLQEIQKEIITITKEKDKSKYRIRNKGKIANVQGGLKNLYCYNKYLIK